MASLAAGWIENLQMLRSRPGQSPNPAGGPHAAHVAGRGSLLKSVVAGLIVLLAAGYCAYIQYVNFTPAFAEPDPDGYIFVTRHIAQGKWPTTYDADPFMHRSHFWVENPSGQISAKFAPGFPLLMAPAYRLGGEEAVYLVTPALGLLTLLGTYMLLRRWMPDLPAALGVVVLALDPMFTFFSGYMLTHVAEMAMVTWGMYFLWGWLESTRRRAPRWGVAAGAALGMAVTVRYTSVLMAAPMFVAVVSRIAFAAGPWSASVSKVLAGPRNVRQAGQLARATASWFGLGLWRDGWKPLLSLGLPFLAFPAALMLYNFKVFGSPFRTGYALSNEQASFTFSNFLENFHILLGGLSVLLPIFFPLAAMGLLLCGRGADRAVRAAWFLAIFLIYAAYYWAPPNTSYFRFVLAALPVLIGAAFLMLESLPVSPAKRLGIMLLLVTVMGLTTAPAQNNALEGRLFGGAGANVVVTRHAAKHLPDNAVIFTIPPFQNTLSTRRDYRVYDLGAFNPNAAEENLGGRYTPRGQPQRIERRKAIYAASTEETLDHDLRALIRDFNDDGRPVFFLVPPDRLRWIHRRLGPDLVLTDFGPALPMNDPELRFRAVSIRAQTSPQ